MNRQDDRMPGAIGMAHYSMLCGERVEQKPAIYAVVDRRRNGALRIVHEFADPQPALAVADSLRAAGSSSAEVVLITAIEALP